MSNFLSNSLSNLDKGRTKSLRDGFPKITQQEYKYTKYAFHVLLFNRQTKQSQEEAYFF